VGDTFDDSGTGRVHACVTHAPHLVVLLECDRPLAGSARYSLDGVDLVNFWRGEGRAAARHDDGGVKTLDVTLPGRSLSKAHARLVRVGASWALEDLGSTNGTLLNGQRVKRAVLEANDLFELGHTFLAVNPSVATTPEWPFDVDSASGTMAGRPPTLQPMLADQFDRLAKIAPSGVPILLLGDSGTGKEVLARWVHAQASREGDFVAVNCGAIPSSLVESTLFGHIKGAFSGAVRDEPGLVRAAHRGTLFLDEIADLPKASQAALLRVLQELEVLPVGGTRPIRVDVRLVTATHQPLEGMVARGDFRPDLFARIAGFTVRLPPLRERRDDFGILVASLLSRAGTERASKVVLAPEVGRALLSYDWPMNIRELEQCLAASMTLAVDGRIEAMHLPPPIARTLSQPPTRPAGHGGALTLRDEQLRLDLLAQLARHQGNLAEVAREMGKARMQIHRWCRRFGVDPNVYRRG
jgi:sigma-54 dependent transcriptional regulator, acetoin dehydrogenase operon transcriptional activator AcoR